MTKIQRGFTLIEVLIALLILAISLLALLKTNAENIYNTQRLKEKIIGELVMKQAMTMIQLKLINFQPNQDLSQTTNMFGQKWYWKAHQSKTAVNNMSQITIYARNSSTGPWNHELISYGINS